MGEGGPNRQTTALETQGVKEGVWPPKKSMASFVSFYLGPKLESSDLQTPVQDTECLRKDNRGRRNLAEISPNRTDFYAHHCF